MKLPLLLCLLCLLLLLPLLHAQKEAIQSIRPGSVWNQTKACLVYLGTSTPARIPGVPVRWEISSWSLGSGGHSHDDNIYDARPLPATNFNLQTTGTDGCVVFYINAPEYSGTFRSVFTIDAAACAAAPTQLSCLPAILEIDVSNQPAFGGPWTFVPLSNGHSIRIMPSHPLKNMYGDAITMTYMKIIDDAWSHIMGNYGESPVVIGHVSLPKGGYLDGPRVGGFWRPSFYLPGGNFDPHAFGYSWDIASPITPVGKAQYIRLFDQFCVGDIYNFANRVALSQLSGGVGTQYWHVYCGELPLGETAYPN